MLSNRRGISFHPSIQGLRDTQREAIEWALSRDEPYLLINAPTGSGKTLINVGYGLAMDLPFTYLTHSIALQQQVAGLVSGLNLVTGRRNHQCLIGEELWGHDVTAEFGTCVAGIWCRYSGKDKLPRPDSPTQRWLDTNGAATNPCSYYEQRHKAYRGFAALANYNVVLSDWQLLNSSKVLLCDEAHNIEEIVAEASAVILRKKWFRKFRINYPRGRRARIITEWVNWARRTPPPNTRGFDLDVVELRNQLRVLSSIDDKWQWLRKEDEYSIQFSPLWGKEFVVPKLLAGKKAVLTSATLLGPEFMASTWGLPDGSWAYLDLSPSFPPERHPINYSPVARLNKDSSIDDLQLQVKVIDHLIRCYLPHKGLVHAVSNHMRDSILTLSGWRAIMTTDPAAHAAATGPSVLVSANVLEGWDGIDDKCRFIIMPKVPFPSLGDQRVKLRQREDPRSYDHLTMKNIIQGVGRGMRHANDWCDSWILDAAWGPLYARRKEWLPKSFLESYHHDVKLLGVD